MNGYEKRTAQKKELILTTARTMFFQHGIANTSVKDIALQCNVSKVTIFKYFGSKEALARVVMKRHVDKMVCAGKTILNEQTPFSEKITKLFALGELNRSLFGTDVFSKEAWEDPFMQHLYSEEASCVMPLIVNFFEQGKIEGKIDPSIPVEALIAYISAITPLLNPGKYNVSSDYVIGIHKLFYHGLFGDISNNSIIDETIKIRKDNNDFSH